ncbi:hypothetical protein Tco_1316091 [Tanacetum coccineum]
MDHCKTQEELGWFDEHEFMGDDDDDTSYLEDYLIKKDPHYYVNEEEERSKERRCELLGVPYIKPPTCKTKKFEYKVNAVEGVNAASEELKEFDLLKWDQQVVSELVALRNFAKRYGLRFCTHGGCIQSSHAQTE